MADEDGIPDDLSGAMREMAEELVVGIDGRGPIGAAARAATRIGEHLAALAADTVPMDHEGTVVRLELRGDLYALLFQHDTETGEWHMGVVRRAGREF